MGKMSVWYTINDPAYPHCRSGLLFTTVPSSIAEDVAKHFYEELCFIVGGDKDVRVWAE